ncbi:MAG: T9SS type B sorting domain-containing protein [Flavobacteriaceae bacterium]|jgi:gliding motility-associated-like protein/uncharacterized repeat protein (TIGR01451 family)|nr:T9SS type B sorting domain-containing protein [Flavobacteriaceae bacterium]
MKHFYLFTILIIFFLFTDKTYSQQFSLINGSFENPVITGGYGFIHQNDVLGWKTTASDGMIEIWRGGGGGAGVIVWAKDGLQHAELNANEVSTLYQSLTTTPGKKMRWSLYHRGRSGTDMMQLLIGPSLTTNTIEGSMSTNSADWKLYKGDYTIPLGQTTTYFLFKSISSAGGPTVGNFLDDVRFSYVSDLELIKTASKNPVTVGEIYTYSIKVKNIGGTPTEQAKVSDVIPTGTQYAPGTLKINGVLHSDSNDGDKAYISSGNIYYDIGIIQPNETVTISFDVKAIVCNDIYSRPAEATYYDQFFSENPVDDLYTKQSNDIIVSSNSDLSVDLGPDRTICEGGNTTLDIGDQPLGSSIVWNTPSGTVSNVPKIIASTSGTYSVTVTTQGGCIATASVEVKKISLNPTISGNTYFCDDNGTTLEVIEDFSSYEWTDGVKVLSTEKEFNVTDAGTYYITVKDKNGCEGKTSITVTGFIKPTISGDLSFCEGGETKLTGSDGFDSYLWTSTAFSGTFSGQEITVTKEGTYYLIVTSEGCSKTTQVTVTVVPYPNIMQVLTSGVDRRAEVIVTPSGNYQYSLNMFTWQSSNVFTNLEIGAYNVWAKTDLGCIAGPFDFKIIEIPNIITPDGDNFNDSWTLRNLKEGTRVQIYDRYGKILFDKTATRISEDIEWDGKYLGKVVPTTSYWYTITLPEGERLTGWLVVRNYHSR